MFVGKTFQYPPFYPSRLKLFRGAIIHVIETKYSKAAV